MLTSNSMHALILAKKKIQRRYNLHTFTGLDWHLESSS